MSTTDHRPRQDQQPDIDLGGGRPRRRLLPALVAIVVIAIAAAFAVRLTGGNDSKAAKYGITIKGVPMEDGNQLDQARPTGSTSTTSTSTSTGSRR